MVRRHQPMHLRAEPARPGARPKGVGQPARDQLRSPAHAAWLGKTAAKGLHFRQAHQTWYVRRRPRHFRPVGTLRTSSTVLATLSLPLAAITMLGLPAAIAAAWAWVHGHTRWLSRARCEASAAQAGPHHEIVGRPHGF